MCNSTFFLANGCCLTTSDIKQYGDAFDGSIIIKINQNNICSKILIFFIKIISCNTIVFHHKVNCDCSWCFKNKFDSAFKLVNSSDDDIDDIDIYKI